MLEAYLAQVPTATWNPARGVWETDQMNLLCEHLEPFLETWPTSGMTRSGRLFERLTRGHLTDANEFLLLRTPVADEAGGGPLSPEMAKHRGQTLRLTGQIIDLVEPGRLPQPLLPTPTTRDYKDTSITVAKHRPDDKDTLSRAFAHLKEGPKTNWGQYADAIHRWEAVLGREAPTPTRTDGQNGQHRLNPIFVEWMMGLEEGHVTSPEIGLSRNDQLKACGNGVVPQQAVLALTNLLGVADGFNRMG